MSVLNLVTKIIQIKNGQYRLTISDKKLLKVFGISALFLLTQISYSKKLRTWSINYFHAFVVGGSITMVFGALLIWILKNMREEREAIEPPKARKHFRNAMDELDSNTSTNHEIVEVKPDL